MLLAVDIGNSNIVMGGFYEDKWLHTERFSTHPSDIQTYRKAIVQFLQQCNKTDTVSTTVVSSVVPDATKAIRSLLDELLSPSPQVIDATYDTGISVGTDQPDKTGTDLIANAAYAYHLVKDHCIVVDFGTATTISVIENPGVMKGGAICAGLRTTKETLAGNAAQLFDVPLTPPATAIGSDTVGAMQSGLVLGHISMIERLTERIKQETEARHVIATGGFASTLAPLTDLFDRVEPMLTLNGIRLIAQRQTEKKS